MNEELFYENESNVRDKCVPQDGQMKAASIIKQPKFQPKGERAKYTVMVPQETVAVLSAANIGGLNFRQLSQLAIREYAERLKAEAQPISA